MDAGIQEELSIMAKTKIIGNYLRKVTNEDGNLEITFEISNYNYKKYCQMLEKKAYSLEINEVKSKRSINQNNYMWALIHEIAQHPNASSNDEWDMYCILLSMANAKSTYIACLEDAVETLKKEVRALQILGYEKRENGTRWARCKVFVGSSKMNKEEMGKLIDTTLDYAEQLGIDTVYYRDVLA